MEEIKPEAIQQVNADDERTKKLITAGYVFAVLGGLIGIFIGQYLAGHRKTLPNGEIVFTHTDDVRKQGRYILTLGTIMFVVFACLKLGRVI
ncbi:hypothetical protein [Mucilaginibacter auburnensis]|uniref:Uncharacterized protein n=1 Tax=Mucilaginibacter auburnensis TaxID=1457233 RepID=A0A2H9VMZ7_9SPHI|nr:hypothetical protein [Mucilaginibacter auburnensis]PJJ79709.1 hypothetical protein CLV57_2846 [Mucilaginibacter auburnensis]